MSLASLAMYASPTPVKEATALFWAALGERLRAGGVDAPVALDDGIRYDEAWLRPDLLFGQTCGYPYVRHLRGKVQLVATPSMACPDAMARSNAVSSSSTLPRQRSRSRN